jgi:hypothetical protein
VDAGGGTDLASATKLFTIRNLTYFLFGFGAVGWLLVATQPALAMWVVTGAAVAAGLLSAGIAAVAFGWLKATESGWQAGEGSWVGCEGRVVLPIGHGKLGQIVVRRGEREHELRALPFSADDDFAGSVAERGGDRHGRRDRAGLAAGSAGAGRSRRSSPST